MLVCLAGLLAFSQTSWSQVTVTGGGAGSYPTIQAAVNAALAGDVITVPTGTYTEQVLITKSLTINGAGVANTIVQAPASMVPGQLAADHRNIIEVRNSATVTITGINVNGPLAPANGCNDLFHGINVNQGASLNLSSSSVTNIYLTPKASFFGCQTGHAIRVGFGLLSSPGSLTATNVTVSGYQKTGIYVDGTGSNGDILNVVVTGEGSTPLIAQNGILFIRGATGNVQSSTITGNNYGPSNTTSTGLLAYNSGAVNASGNTFTGNDAGLYGYADVVTPGLVTANNNTFSNQDYAGMYSQPTGLVVGSGNTFDKSVTNNNKPGNVYSTIQKAIDEATAGDVLTASAGLFDEQVLVNKGVTIVGQGASTTVSLSGTPTGKPTLFDVSADGVTIQGIHFVVDLSKLRSAIIASNAGIDNIAIKDNIVDPTSAAPGGAYGERNAISINYAAYRVATGGVNSITATGNTVNGNGASTFRAGIAVDEGGGTFTGNSIQSINQDIQVRFGSNGDVNVSNNTIRGGGIELAEHNSGAGNYTVNNNTFDGTFGSTYTSLLRLKNNNNAKPTTVSGNTFTGHNWGISLENYQAVTVSNNQFTPATSSTTYRHVTFDTKDISSSSGTFAPVVSLTLTGNTFNGSSTPGSGTAVAFYNQDNDNPVFGPIVVGASGSANDFNSSVGTFIALDGNTGLVAPNNTQAAPFSTNLSAVNNRFDVGSGLKFPSLMSPSERATLETKLLHKPDNAALGLISYFNPVQNVTQNQFYPTIQSAVNAANTGDFIQLGEYAFDEQVLVNKGVTIAGQGTSTTVSLSGTPTGKPTLFDVSADGVTIQNIHFVVDLSKLRSAIIASAAGIDNIAIKDNIVDPIGAPAGAYGERNAISINYAAYRVATGGVNSITATGNTVNGNGLTNSFRSGIAVDEGGGTFTGNNIQSISQDIQVRFGSNGDVNVSNNTIRGGGIELAEHNSGAGNYTVNNNTFDGTFGSPYTSLLRLKNNTNAKATTVSGNTFTGHTWGISLENYQAVTINNNQFTPLSAPTSGTTTYRHVTFNTKDFSSSSGFHPPAVGMTLTNNTFNGPSTPYSGTAVIFLNQDNDNPTFNPIVLGTAGAENNFSAGLENFIVLDGSTGTVNPNSTPAAPFAINLSAINNRFDVGNGLQLPSAMSSAERAALETKLFHKPDNASLGLISYFNPVQNVTQNQFYPTIQQAVDAANANDVIQLAEYTFNEHVNVTKPLNITGVSQTGTIIDGTGAGQGNGFTLTDNVAGITIQNLTIKNQIGAGNNALGNGIRGQTNSNLTISGVISASNGTHGVILETSGTLTNVSVTNSTLASNGIGAGGRGFIIFNQLKQNITLTNNVVINNGLSGIDINEGTATGLTITGNTMSGNADGGLSVLGAIATGGANLISGNTINNSGRYGMEVKSSIGTGAASGPGSLVIENNTIAGATNLAGTRDVAGISVTRRAAAVSVNNQETPKGTIVRNNTVSGFVQPNDGEGFGIVVEGINYLVEGNTVSDNDIGIQEQQTPTGQRGRTNGTPTDGDSPYDVSNYFDRGNSLYACGVIGTNNLSNNAIPTRQVGTVGNPPITLTASSPISCTAPSVTLTATAGFSSYTFSAGTSQPDGPTSNTASVSTVGTYSVTATNAVGCVSTTAVTVVGSTTATPVNLTASGPISCTAANVTLTATAGFSSYTFSAGATQQNGSTGNTATVTTAGTYTVSAANESGCISTTTISVTGSTTPTPVDLTTSGTLSCSSASVTLTATAGFTTYIFSAGAAQQGGSAGNTATVNVAGTYSVTAINASSCQSTTMVTVTGSTTATPVSLTTSGTLSCSTTSVTLTATAGFTTYAFSAGAAQQGGSTGNTATVNVAGTYSVTATNASGCQSTTTITVTGSTTATPVDLVASGSISCTAATVTLTATAGFTSYTFSTGATQQGGSSGNTATVTTAGMYSVSATNASGCISSTMITVAGSTTATPVTLATSGTLSCSTPSVTLTATPGFTTYIFSAGAAQQGGSSGNTATVNVAGIYSVTAINASSCQSTTTVTVTGSTTATQVSLTTSGTLSCSTTSVTLTATAGFTTYSFSAGATQQGGASGNTATVNVAGTYSVTATNASGCSSMTMVTVTGSTTATPVGLVASGPISCSAPSVTLTATAGFTTYAFSAGATQQGGSSGNTATVNLAGTYSVTATNASGCQSTTIVTVVGSSTATPVGLASSGSISCSTPNATLTATPGFTTYIFSAGATQQGGSSGNTATVNVAGTYSVTAINASGCQSTTNVTVAGSTTASSVSLTASGTLSCSVATVTLTATSGFTSYAFSAGAAQQGSSAGSTATVSMTGVYSVTATNGDGCSSTASVTVGYQNCPPTVANPIGPQSATVNQFYSFVIPANTFTDSETPANLTLSVNGLPAGLGFTPPATISGTPSTTLGSPFSVTVTATDPGGLAANTTFTLTVNPASTTGTGGSFAITSVNLLSCSQLDQNRRSISFNPVYSGLTGQPISFSVVNELPATTVAGPYQLNLYNDNPVITLKATQQGTPGEATFSYNWMAACMGMPAQNTPPTVVAPISPQTATVNQTYSFVIPAGTFTDAETPASLTLAVTGLPAGISFFEPNFISGTPTTSTGSPFSVTVTATDKGGLSTSTTFTLTVNPASTTATFGITSVNLISCTTLSPNRKAISFNPVYSGVTGQPISFSVVNELAPTTAAGPYQLNLYTDNPTIILKATQQNTPGEVSYSYNWLAACNNTPSTNTQPTVANSIAPQSATVNQGYSFEIPANTFTDAETPNNLALTVNGLPAGLMFTAPATISGTPSTSAGSPYSVTVTATDPGGLAASTTFTLTVNPPSSTPGSNFAITGATLVNCSSLSPNRRAISFSPVYSGLNGQQITFSVVNELAPTTAAGPYQLNLYTDNPVITLKATQQGSAGEATYSYNWLEACNTVPSTNTPPTVANPIGPQSATVNFAYNFTIPANTFNDAETPSSLALSVSGLPAGLNFTPPATISGAPSTSAGSPYTITVTATDPGGLTATTSFQLTVNSNAGTPAFMITGANLVNCTTLSPNRRAISFNPVYSGVTGQPISFSVVNELAPTTAAGPYQLNLYTDNPTIVLKATQQGSAGEATFNYNWLAACSTPGRSGVAENQLRVVVLGNPVVGESVDVEVKGAENATLRLNVVNAQGQPIHGQTIEQPNSVERVRMNVGTTSGIYLLEVQIPGQRQIIKLMKP